MLNLKPACLGKAVPPASAPLIRSESGRHGEWVKPAFSVAVECRPATRFGHWNCPLNLAFPTLALRQICLSQTKAEAKYGYRVARQLRARLTDLRSADTISDLPPVGRPREIHGNPHNKYAIDLDDGYRLVLRANHSEVPLKKSGRVDWAIVSRVMIVGIEVSHD